jgi:hypothetical protein
LSVTVLELPVVPPVAFGVVWVKVAVLVTVEVVLTVTTIVAVAEAPDPRPAAIVQVTVCPESVIPPVDAEEET